MGGNVYTVPGPAPPAAAPVLILCGALGFRRILLFLLRFVSVVSPFSLSFLLLLVRAHEAVVPALVVVPELVADAVESARSKNIY